MTKINSEFHKLLQEQIGLELVSSNQYLAMSIHYDNLDMPQMTDVFKGHADEEYDHAMQMIHYLQDAGIKPEVPEIPAVRNDFDGFVEPVRVAFEHEQFVTSKIEKLARVARDSYDFSGESFITKFIDEQVEEEAYFSRLLAIVEEEGASVFEIENWVAREIAAK